MDSDGDETPLLVRLFVEAPSVRLYCQIKSNQDERSAMDLPFEDTRK